MKVRFTKSFRNKLNDQIKYIAEDKSSSARKFKSGLMERISEISKMPFQN